MERDRTERQRVITPRGFAEGTIVGRAFLKACRSRTWTRSNILVREGQRESVRARVNRFACSCARACPSPLCSIWMSEVRSPWMDSFTFMMSMSNICRASAGQTAQPTVTSAADRYKATDGAEGRRE